jgi:hypothetical protein
MIKTPQATLAACLNLSPDHAAVPQRHSRDSVAAYRRRPAATSINNAIVTVTTTKAITHSSPVDELSIWPNLSSLVAQDSNMCPATDRFDEVSFVQDPSIYQVTNTPGYLDDELIWL